MTFPPGTVSLASVPCTPFCVAGKSRGFQKSTLRRGAPPIAHTHLHQNLEHTGDVGPFGDRGRFRALARAGSVRRHRSAISERLFRRCTEAGRRVDVREEWHLTLRARFRGSDLTTIGAWCCGEILAALLGPSLGRNITDLRRVAAKLSTVLASAEKPIIRNMTSLLNCGKPTVTSRLGQRSLKPTGAAF